MDRLRKNNLSSVQSSIETQGSSFFHHSSFVIVRYITFSCGSFLLEILKFQTWCVSGNRVSTGGYVIATGEGWSFRATLDNDAMLDMKPLPWSAPMEDGDLAASGESHYCKGMFRTTTPGPRESNEVHWWLDNDAIH